MFTPDMELGRGLSALRIELWTVLCADAPEGWLRSDAVHGSQVGGRGSDPGSGRSSDGGSGRGSGSPGNRGDDAGAEEHAEADRLVALVDLAREGDAEAFGLLYDHYHASIYRFVYYRVGSVPLAEDLVSETFFRALRGMRSFRWQGKDFGAWLTTIARNLTNDHFKAGRTRLEYATDDMSVHEGSTAGREGPEETALAALTNEILLAALEKLPHEQQECLVMRFLQGLSIAETAKVLGRSEGAVKQLQLRAVRNMAKRLPEGLR
jgi:RNA polymerase sigma-70 factor, ECF subfamily